VLDKATAQAPEERYNTAKEMADAILEAIKPLRPAEPDNVIKFLRSISPKAMRGIEGRVTQPVDIPVIPPPEEETGERTAIETPDKSAPRHVAEDEGDSTVQMGKRPTE
jgi:hypothetical protein